MHTVERAPARWRQRRAGLHLTAATAFVLTSFVRFMEVVGFPNDHMLYIAAGQQMLFGELPSRDFVDPGTPLMYAASAAAQLATGSPLLGEAVLIAVAFGFAAGLTVYGAFRLSGSLTIAALATAIEVAMFPRTYHYPKLLVCAAGLLAIWRYLDQPSRSRAVTLAACVAAAFLLRHDLGVYLAAAGAIGIAGSRQGWSGAVRRTMAFLGLAILLLLPYGGFVAWTTGVRAHVEGGLMYSRAEADRTRLPLQTFDLELVATPENARVWLFYTFHALPVIALAIAFHRLRRDASEAARIEAARVLPLAVLGMAVNVALLRDPLQARLPDASVTACLLGAWVIGRTVLRAPWRVPFGLLAAPILIVTLTAVDVVGTPREQLDRTGLLTSPPRWLRILRDHISELRSPIHPRQTPGRTERALIPFMRYLRRCTAPDDRLFVAGEAPGLYVASGRPFGGGQHLLRSAYFSTMADQERLVARLRQQRVPIALVLMGSDAERVFTRVVEELNKAFVPVTEIQAHEGQRVSVRVNRRINPPSTDLQTGFPCFR
jgi:hypothetical protein